MRHTQAIAGVFTGRWVNAPSREGVNNWSTRMVKELLRARVITGRARFHRHFDHSRHAREGGPSSTPRLLPYHVTASGILDRPLTRAMTLNVWQERRLKRKRRGFGPASFALNIQLAAYLTLGSRSPCRARLARRRGGRSGRGRASRRRSRGRSRDRRRRRRDRRRARRRCRP